MRRTPRPPAISLYALPVGPCAGTRCPPLRRGRLAARPAAGPRIVRAMTAARPAAGRPSEPHGRRALWEYLTMGLVGRARESASLDERLEVELGGGRALIGVLDALADAVTIRAP